MTCLRNKFPPHGSFTKLKQKFEAGLTAGRLLCELQTGEQSLGPPLVPRTVESRTMTRTGRAGSPLITNEDLLSKVFFFFFFGVHDRAEYNPRVRHEKTPYHSSFDIERTLRRYGRKKPACLICLLIRCWLHWSRRAGGVSTFPPSLRQMKS